MANGITKQIGDAHRKHFPARAERSHRTILGLAKANHIQSKLPISYYSDAHRYATYVVNRMVRYKAVESPYEMIFNQDVSLDNIMGFGSICYVTLPKSKRMLGKLEDTGIRCRFLGFGDNELDEVQNQGYKLLRESDQRIIYSSNVVFTLHILIEPLNKTSERYVDFYESLTFIYHQ